MTSPRNKPKPGWWAVPHTIGNDKRMASIPEPDVLACLGLLLAAEGYCIANEQDIITEAELTRHLVVGAASTESVLTAARHLIEAGIWTKTPDGIDCGAAPLIQQKQDRIERSRRGGLAKGAKSQPSDADVPDEPEDGAYYYEQEEA